MAPVRSVSGLSCSSFRTTSRRRCPADGRRDRPMVAHLAANDRVATGLHTTVQSVRRARSSSPTHHDRVNVDDLLDTVEPDRRRARRGRRPVSSPIRPTGWTEAVDRATGRDGGGLRDEAWVTPSRRHCATHASVGSGAGPVACQNTSPDLLPTVSRDREPLGITRREDSVPSGGDDFGDRSSARCRWSRYRAVRPGASITPLGYAGLLGLFGSAGRDPGCGATRATRTAS